jgi:hypothetical protein
MSLVEWMRRVAGLELEQQERWSRQLLLVNTVRGIVGEDPLSLDDLVREGSKRRVRPEETAAYRAKWDAFIGRNIDWINRVRDEHAARDGSR